MTTRMTVPRPGAMDTDDIRTILIGNDLLAIAERMTTTTARLMKADFSEVETKQIHRFHRSLRGIASDNDRYIMPSVVAIGPYHHGVPHLHRMEEVKLAAAYYFCWASGHSIAEVYEKVRSVAGTARACYDANDPAVAGLGDAEFAAMMFLDGCFLLQCMVGGGDDPMVQKYMMSTGPNIDKDIFLLENQIPWLVLEVLREFMLVDVQKFVAGVQEKLRPGKAQEKGRERRAVNIGSVADTDGWTPPHLLGLLWYTQAAPSAFSRACRQINTYYSFQPMFSNAVELAEIGIRLKPSTKPWFWDMSFHPSYLFGELSLSPVLLTDTTACWLVNLAALEEATKARTSAGFPGTSWKSAAGYVVSSYLFMLATLMDREEEVQQMRSNSILHSTLSNKQALRFFKDLADHLRFGGPYIDACLGHPQ